MATYYERQRVLREEFQQIGLNNDQQLTKGELYGSLDSKEKLGRQFDRVIAEQLWGKSVEANPDIVKVDKFVDTIIQAEDILKGKIETCRRQLESNYKHKRETESKLFDLQKSEQLNIYGVMDSSTCSVIVVSGSNLKFSDLSHTLDPYVVVRLDKQEFQTPLAKGANPEWLNQKTFIYNVVTGREDLQISVCDFDKFSNNSVIGRININLTNNNLKIRDQIKHDLQLELYDQTGGLTGGQIRIQIQWIYSRVRYLTDALNSFKSQVQEQEEELQDYEYDLNCLYEPFLKWQYLYKGLQINQNQTLQELQPIKILNTVTPQYRKQPFNDPALEPFELFQISKLVVGAFLLFSLFACFEKCAFLDIVIICDFVILYEWNALNEGKFISLVVLLIFSTLLDIPWLMIYSSVIKIYHDQQNWISEPDYIADKDEIIESPTKRFVAFTVILCLLLKIVISVLFFMLSQKLKLKSTSILQQRPILKIDLQGLQLNTNLQASRLFIKQGKVVEIY